MVYYTPLLGVDSEKSFLKCFVPRKDPRKDLRIILTSRASLPLVEVDPEHGLVGANFITILIFKLFV